MGWKTIKNRYNFENEKNSFSKFENVVFFLCVLEFEKSFSIRFNIWKIVLKFFKMIFEKILFAHH